MARSAPPTFRSGSRWYNDAANPADSLGLDGDYFLNTTTGGVWSKAGGAWVDTTLTIKVHDEASLARLNAVQVWDTQSLKPQTLAHNTAWDARNGGLLLLEVNGSDVTLLAPTNLPANTTFLLVITYTTVNAVLLPSIIKGVSDLTFAPSAGQKEALTLLSDETGTNLQCVGYEPDIAGS